MYVQLDHPDDLKQDILIDCKYCYTPDAAYAISWPMNKADLALSTGKETMYTYAAHCKGCGGLSVVVLKGSYPELDSDFEAVDFG